MAHMSAFTVFGGQQDTFEASLDRDFGPPSPAVAAAPAAAIDLTSDDEGDESDGQNAANLAAPGPSQASNRASAAPSTPRRQIRWNRPATRAFLIALANERREGRLFATSNKGTALKEVLAAILPGLQAQFPEMPLSVSNLQNKYHHLQTQYRQALNIVQYSGGHYDDESGLYSTSAQNWEQFKRKWPNLLPMGPGGTGIPWVTSLMPEVWPHTMATGRGIFEINARSEGDSSMLSEASTQASTPSQMTPSQRWDPESNPSPEPSRYAVQRRGTPARRIHRKRQLPSDRAAIAQSLRGLGGTPGAAVVEEAIAICHSEFHEELGFEGVLNAGVYFGEHVMNATIFVALPSESRRLFLQRFNLLARAEEAVVVEERQQDMGDTPATPMSFA